MLHQVLTGVDIPKVEPMLKRLSAEDAARTLDGFPYSILTNLAHMDFWQRVWLARLEGTPRPGWKDDWKMPDPSQFSPLRISVVNGMKRAIALASADPFIHQMKSDDVAVKTLIAMAVHDAYHIGQIKLIARVLSSVRDKDTA